MKNSSQCYKIFHAESGSRLTATHKSVTLGTFSIVQYCASVVKLVDTMDSKSIAFTGVAVRVRPLVPDLLDLSNPSED